MPRLTPADRSKWLAVIGINTASATSACTDLLLRIDLMLNSVGKVSGRNNEKTTNNTISRTSRPQTEMARVIAGPTYRLETASLIRGLPLQPIARRLTRPRSGARRRVRPVESRIRLGLG